MREAQELATEEVKQLNAKRSELEQTIAKLESDRSDIQSRELALGDELENASARISDLRKAVDEHLATAQVERQRRFVWPSPSHSS